MVFRPNKFFSSPLRQNKLYTKALTKSASGNPRRPLFACIPQVFIAPVFISYIAFLLITNCRCVRGSAEIELIEALRARRPE